MKKLIGLLLVLSVLSGCKTTDFEPKPVSWERQQVYLSKTRDPRLFGLGIYQTPGGVKIRGGGRLHPSQGEMLPMLLEEPWRPVVQMDGRSKVQWPVLIDFTAANSRFGFDMALEAGAHPVSEGRAQLVTIPGDDVSGCVSLISSIRLGQLFVENPLVLVRMSTELSDVQVRDIVEPRPRGVLGWDIFKEFEQVQFLYSLGQIVFKTTDEYVPNPGVLVAQVPLRKHMGACVVQGTVDGQSVPVFVDPAGDFEVATPQGEPVASFELAKGLEFPAPVVVSSPGGVRIGARLLERYRVTVCPKRGVIYFEVRPAADS